MSNNNLNTPGYSRWLILLAGVAMQAILGGIYAWSKFIVPLTEQHGLSNSQCSLIFGVTIAVFTIAMIFAGFFLNKNGPRLTAGIGTALFMAGYTVASYSNGDFYIILLGIGFISGTGIGFGYVCPLTTGMKWFPDHRGLVTGVSVAGFGGGAILLSSLASFLLENSYSTLEIFRIIGLGLGSIAFISAMFLRDPDDAVNKKKPDFSEFKQDLFSSDFALAAFGMFSGTFVGLLLVGNLKPIILEKGFDDGFATFAISLFALGNITGRIVWGQICDKFATHKVIIALFAFFAVSMGLFLFNAGTGMTGLVIVLLGTGFGGCFVVFATDIVETFGLEYFSELYPCCFLAYGFAALAGPPFAGLIADSSGSFKGSLIVSLGILCLTLITLWYFYSKKAQLISINQTHTAA